MTNANEIVCTRCNQTLATSETELLRGMENGTITLGRMGNNNVMHAGKCGASYDGDKAKPRRAQNGAALKSWGLRIVSESRAKTNDSDLTGPPIKGVKRLQACSPSTPKAARKSTTTKAPKKSQPRKPAPKAPKQAAPKGSDPVAEWAREQGASEADIAVIALARAGQMAQPVAEQLLSAEACTPCLSPSWSVPVPVKAAPPEQGTVHTVDGDLLAALLAVAEATGEAVPVSLSLTVNGKAFTHSVNASPAQVRTLIG